MARLRVASFMVLVLWASCPFGAGGAERARMSEEDRILVHALKTELGRHIEVYKEQDPPAYFLQYEATDWQSSVLVSSYGATLESEDRHHAWLDVDIRIGSPKLDNSHPIRSPQGWSASYARPISVTLPLDPDEEAIRAHAWSATDQAFRHAQTLFLQVESNRELSVEEEDTSPDFSEWKRESFVQRALHPEFERTAWESKLRRLSSAFKARPEILTSRVELVVTTENRTLVNSEGSEVLTGRTRTQLYIRAEGLAEDGMAVRRYRTFTAASPEDLPDEKKLQAATDAIIEEVLALRSAPIVDPYTGPAILKGLAAAVFFHEVIGHRVEGHRQKREDEGQTFAEMVGDKILPEFLSIYDDPTVSHQGDTPLNGHYLYDSEGVPAARASIVDKGKFTGFLLSRSPIEGFPKSNGHARRSRGNWPTARQGNLIVESASSMPYEELEEMFVAELKKQEKPFGLVFEQVSGGSASTKRGGPQAFQVQPLLVRRIYADGRPSELVRGVGIVGTPLSILENILAAGDDPAVFNGSCGAESGSVPVSAVSPSLLVSSIEVERQPRQQRPPPILPPALHDTESSPEDPDSEGESS